MAVAAAPPVVSQAQPGGDGARSPFLDWPKIFGFFGYAYLLRVPLLLFAAIGFLTYGGLFHRPGESLFSGIYDVAWLGSTSIVDSLIVVLRFVVLTLMTFVFGTALAVTTRNIVAAGEVRFRLEPVPKTRGVELAYAVPPFILCATILVGTVWRASQWGVAVAGVIIGVLLFLLLIGVVHFTDQAYNRFAVTLLAAMIISAGGLFTVEGFQVQIRVDPRLLILMAFILFAAKVNHARLWIERLWTSLLSRIPCDGAGYFEPPNGPARRLLSRHVAAAKQFTIALILYVLFFLAKYRGTSGVAFGSFPVLPTLSMVLVMATLLCWFLAGLTFFLDRYRVPILIPLAIYALSMSGFPQSDHFYRAVSVNADEHKLPASAVLRAHRDEPVVVVASTGGGIQAGAWMTRVLRGLEKETQAPAASPSNPNYRDLAHSIRLISAVSGGSVGAIDFLSTYLPGNKSSHGPCTTVTAGDLNDDCVVAAAEASSLDEVAFGLAYQDLLLNLFPFVKGIDFRIDNGKPHFWIVNGRGIFADRGANLEESFKRLSAISSTGAQQATLKDWEQRAAAGDMPTAILNATIAETGERLLLSTTEIDPAGPAPRNSVRGRVNFYDRYPGFDIGIATAARLSATFPYVSPASRLFYGDVYGSANHVIDGGYADGYGVASLIDWLDSGLNKLKQEHLTLSKGVLILEIRSSPTTFTERERSHRGLLFQMYHPIAALYNVRETGQFSHDQAEVELLEDRWRSEKIPICSIPFEYPAAPDEVEPLSWHLTAANIDSLDRAWAAFETGSKRDAVDRVKDYLAGKPVCEN